MQPDEVLGRLTAVASPVIGRVDVLEQSSASASTMSCDLAEHLVLQLLTLEHRLDDEVAPGQVGRLLGRLDPGEHLIGLRPVILPLATCPPSRSAAWALPRSAASIWCP